MGLLIFLVIGALLGWLAAVIMRVEDGPRVVANLAAGGAGAAIAGSVANRGSVLYGITALSIPVAIGGALLTLAIVSWIRSRRDGA